MKMLRTLLAVVFALLIVRGFSGMMSSPTGAQELSNVVFCVGGLLGVALIDIAVLLHTLVVKQSRDDK